MRVPLVLAACLVAATLVAPTAAALPYGCGCDPLVLLLVAQVVVACASQEVASIVGGADACLGLVPAVERFVGCAVDGVLGDGSACA